MSYADYTNQQTFITSIVNVYEMKAKLKNQTHQSFVLIENGVAISLLI